MPGTEPEKVTALVRVPLHSDWVAIGDTAVDGLTVMENVSAVPVHKPVVGVTVIVDTTGEVPLFVAVKEAMFPAPLATRPMVTSELVQL